MDHIPVMGDKEQGLASFTAGLREQLGDFACIVIVEIAGRFVSENDNRIVGEGAGDCNTLLLTAA
jgi:hypothetical protein